MGFKISQLKTDEDKTINGVWRDYNEGSKVLLASSGSGNKRFKTHLSKLLKPSRRQIRRGDIIDLGMSEINEMRAASKDVILDWKGILDDEGKEIPYSPEAGFQLFQQIPEFYYDLMDMASEHEFYKSKEDSDAEKNSSTTSTGSSNIQDSQKTRDYSKQSKQKQAVRQN